MISDNIVNEIANMDFSDFIDPREKFDELMTLLNEYTTTVDTINSVVPAYKNIKEFGVTNSIYETYNQLLWDKVQFDITPFVNCSTEQMMYGIEGLGAVIRKIYEILRNIIWKLKDFFTSDSILAKWFNPAQRVYDNVIKTRDLCRKNGSTLNVDKYSNTVVTTFEYAEFHKRLIALERLSEYANIIIGNVGNVNIDVIQKSLIGLNSGENMRILHIKMSPSGKAVELEKTNLVRMDKIFQLGWAPNKFMEDMVFVERVCKRGIVMKSRIVGIKRALEVSERNIADVLTGHKEPQVVRDQDSIKALNLYLSILNVMYELIRGTGNHWCHVGRAYLNACSSYKAGLFS